MWLEVTWSVIPLLIALVIFGWGADVFFALAKPPSDAAEYYAVGKQWMWKLQHPDGKREINELHVPVGRPIKMTMTSEDVIHSFFVPAFRVKSRRAARALHDGLVRGDEGRHVPPLLYGVLRRRALEDDRQRPRHGRARPTRSGCTPATSPKSVAATGEELFVRHSCNTCHRDDSTVRAPQLRGVFGQRRPLVDGRTVVADDNYLRESILNPAYRVVQGYDPVMPTFQGQLSEEDVLALIRYIKELDGSTDAASEQGSTP